MDNPIYAYPIEKVLEALGSKKGHGKDMWFSPFRNESEASLHIDRRANVWYDQGAGIGGTNVNLVMLVKHCSAKEAEAFIQTLGPNIVEKVSQEEVQKKTCELLAVKDITNKYLLNYLERRKIPLCLAQHYCKEVVVRNHEKGMTFTLLGFPNNRGAFAFSSPTGYKSTNKAAPTFIDTGGRLCSSPSSKNVAIFEGFFDFLSWQVMQGSIKPNTDVAVLNSVNNLGKAMAFIDRHDKAYCFADNDPTGKRCLEDIRTLMGGRETIDMSDLYSQQKDLNEMLQASRGYNASMSLTPGM